MNQYFGYIRVSTVKQGERGVSLQEQRDAILRFAQRNDCEITRWFEEQETAAKRGRPIFNNMIKLLRSRGARGVIIHKIDRSARNLRDWADLGDLIDEGVDVFFVNESLDLHSRGGRLSADIQAVVASDYIRNLREETKKGFYGRLKQGLYPMPAPLGYLDMGQGKTKAPDPVRAPLIQKAFELYGTGRFNSERLARELELLGLRTRSGRLLAKSKVTRTLTNPFYMGLIRIKKTNETYQGNHEPLVSKRLFDRVQDLIYGRKTARTEVHDFLFRKRLHCGRCDNRLVGETHKGFVYYRCHTEGCPTTAVREEVVEDAVLQKFQSLWLSADEREYAQIILEELKVRDGKLQEDAIDGLALKLKQNEDHLNRLTDAYIDRLIDKDTFEGRKNTLLAERISVEEKLTEWRGGKVQVSEHMAVFLERAEAAYSAYKAGKLDEKRDLIDSLTSNRILMGKTLEISLVFPFNELAHRVQTSHGGPSRCEVRTLRAILMKVIASITTDEHDAHQLAA